MNFPPTLKQLRYLVALHRSLHFGKAADACHVSQSTLSAGIQELENLLGLQLVERTKRSVMFTAVGTEVVSRARSILSDVDDLTDMAAAAKDPLMGKVRMGIIPTIAPFLLPVIMPTVAMNLPDLDMYLREDKSQVLCDMLRDGELDVVLYALPFRCGDAEEMPLFDDAFLAAYPAGRTDRDTITLDDLDGEQVLLLEEGHCLRDHALSACRLVDGSGGNELSGTSLHTVLQMVASGTGMTLLPEMAVEAGIAANVGVDIVPFAGTRPTRTIGLIWRRASPRAETFRAIGTAIQAAVSASA